MDITTVGTKVLGRKGFFAVNRGALVVRKYSPEILTGTGIVGGVVATVMACRATLRLEDTVDSIQARINLVKEKQVEVNDDGSLVYNPAELQKDLVKAQLRGGLDLVKLYGPSFALGLASIAAHLGSLGISRRRQAALIAAYSVVQEGWKNYRARVIEEYGEDIDKDFLAGVKTERNEKGEVVQSTRVTTESGKKVPSQYARFFDQFSQYWDKTPEYNLAYLNMKQSYFNDMLQARGHVFLNEVYDALGIDRSKAGAVVGWVLSKDGGDNYIDFGHTDYSSRDFLHGNAPGVLLDFNVDGVILDKIDYTR